MRACWTVLALFVILWLVGFSFRIADGLAYVLLRVVLAAVILGEGELKSGGFRRPFTQAVLMLRFCPPTPWHDDARRETSCQSMRRTRSCRLWTVWVRRAPHGDGGGSRHGERRLWSIPWASG